jgi:hypothetical protein
MVQKSSNDQDDADRNAEYRSNNASADAVGSGSSLDI